ncbi:cytochrome c biogenesis protein CcsA [Parafilimonas sp.]|uniref:cytochrome c biogenesis protein CcsA n=1 Tax=Parafilimonas sp. TaxID=1969739 RepID=UPI0039E4CBC8
MKYNDEHLFYGELGHFLAVLSFVASLIATIAYWKASRNKLLDEQRGWIKFGRLAFAIETISVLGIFLLMYLIIANHYHEYYYSWNHSSRSLEKKYLFASFWEGQEGSFMLWNTWHCLLGWILIWRSKKWEAPVMTVVSFAQFCISTMLLGIYVGSLKIGSNPFALLRHELPAPVLFQNPDYLQFPRIFEGNDLNSALQNYWMVIHPPILFLGFASTVVPFAYAMGGLMKNDHTWVKASIPWAAFSGAVLGTGIMMGAAWAYEALNFGGYWAWDPVENASLVPWLVMIAGLHTGIVYKSSGYSLKSTYIFFILSFCLVLYSTFLTRSGILGDTSVHAFTERDMTTQLVGFVLVFFIPAMVLFFYRSKSMPAIKKEESTYSREFWMFIGALVLFLAAIIIIAKTSIPVYNKVFGTNVAMPEDTLFSYNQVQIFIAIIIGILTAATQYFKYRNTDAKTFYKKIAVPTVIALIISLCISFIGNINYTEKGAGFMVAIHVAMFAAVYSVVANAAYIWIGLKGKTKSAGASVAHIGFGLALVGILISSSRQTILSQNTTGIALLPKSKDYDPQENVTLFKGIKTDMGKYDVTYLRDTLNNSNHKRYFEVNFVSKDGRYNFNIYPDLINNNKGIEGRSANPDTKHYFDRDIYVSVSAAQDGRQDDTSQFKPIEMKPGDSAFYSNGIIVMNGVVKEPDSLKQKLLPGEVGIGMNMTVISKDGMYYKAMPEIALKDNQLRQIPDTVIAQSLIIKFNKLTDPAAGKIELGIKEDQSVQDIITLKVYLFPFVSLLWIGIIIMVAGFVMSIVQRVRTGLKTTELINKA